MVKKEVEHAIQRVYIYIHIYALFEKKKKKNSRNTLTDPT